MKLRLLTSLACGTVTNTAITKKRHGGVWVRDRGINPFFKLSFRLSIHEETADKSDKRKLRSKVHFTGIFRLSGKMSNTFACFSAILKVIIK